MRIVYDARFIGEPLSGLGRFTGDLLLELLQSDIRPEVRVDVLAPRLHDAPDNPYPALLRPHVEARRCVVHHVGIPAISLEQQWSIPRVLRRLGGDLYFYPHFDVPAASPIPFLFVVHDIIPLKVPGYVLRFEALKKTYFRRCIARGLQRSRRCVAVSATTKEDMLGEFGAQWESKIDVSYEGSAMNAAEVDHGLRHALGVERPYLLYVGTRRPNKNIRFMLDTYVEMRKRGYAGELVMAGATKNFGFDADRYLARVEGVRTLGPVSDAQLASLYAGMESMIFLSKYEGFGLPVIEAAKFGRRMIVSDGGAVGEIAPPSACVIPLRSTPDAAAAAAIAYLHRSDEVVDLSPYIEKFCWQSVVRRIFREAY